MGAEETTTRKSGSNETVMQYSQNQVADATFELHIGGNLDAVTAPDLRPVIGELADKAERVVVDLSELELIDSSGVAALVSLFKKLRARGGEMSLRGARDQPLAILKLLRLDRVLDLDERGPTPAAAEMSK